METTVFSGYSQCIHDFLFQLKAKTEVDTIEAISYGHRARGVGTRSFRTITIVIRALFWTYLNVFMTFSLDIKFMTFLFPLVGRLGMQMKSIGMTTPREKRL